MERVTVAVDIIAAAAAAVRVVAGCGHRVVATCRSRGTSAQLEIDGEWTGAYEWMG